MAFYRNSHQASSPAVFKRHCFTFRKSGINMMTKVSSSIVTESGLVTRIDKSPWDIISDWRSARSMTIAQHQSKHQWRRGKIQLAHNVTQKSKKTQHPNIK